MSLSVGRFLFEEVCSVNMHFVETAKAFLKHFKQNFLIFPRPAATSTLLCQLAGRSVTREDNLLNAMTVCIKTTYRFPG